MEKRVKSIYYVGIEEEKRMPEKGKLSVYRQVRTLPFEGGLLQIYFSFLPIQAVTPIEGHFFKRKRNLRMRQLQWSQLEEAITFVQGLPKWDGEDDVIFSERLQRELNRSQDLPLELYAVCLKKVKTDKKSDLSTVSLSFPDDCGEITVEGVRRLLLPYLPRMNVVIYVGEESEATRQLEVFLYEEYGILLSYEKKPHQDAVWIDLREKAGESLNRYAIENKIYHLNSAEVWKFLDTTVKNGYNTKVN